MENVLESIMEQLCRISVHGDDVERMCFVKQNIRNIQNALKNAKKDEQKTE